MEALRLVGTFLRVGVQNELQYRSNVVFSLLQSLVAVGTSLAVLGLVFGHTDSLGGWSGPELLVVMGVYVLVGGVLRSVVQPSMNQLMDDVQHGTLDFVLTKPADSMLLVSIRRIELWQAVDVLVGAGIIGVAVARLDRPVGLLAALGFVVALLLGVVVLLGVLAAAHHGGLLDRAHRLPRRAAGRHVPGRPLAGEHLPGVAADRVHLPGAAGLRDHRARPGPDRAAVRLVAAGRDRVHRGVGRADPAGVVDRAAQLHRRLLLRSGLCAPGACAAPRAGHDSLALHDPFLEDISDDARFR